MSTPIVFIIFNRPELTTTTFEVIRAARPSRLFVIADGPRPGRKGETERCRAARDVIEGVDWPCEVVRDYSENNLGCRKRISSGLDRVFQQCSQAVIVEDDCVLDSSFFRFCDELLDRYRDDHRVMHIGAFNPIATNQLPPTDYFFSRLMMCWGWATWADRWALWSKAMETWRAEPGRLRDVCFGPLVGKFYHLRMLDVLSGRMSSWAYQWQVASLLAGKVCVIPTQNLVKNAGFGGDGTHCLGDDPFANVPVGSIRGDLRHPSEITATDAIDKMIFRRINGDIFTDLDLASHEFWNALRYASQAENLAHWFTFARLAPASLRTYRMLWTLLKSSFHMAQPMATE